MFVYCASDKSVDNPFYHLEALVSATSLCQHTQKPIRLISSSQPCIELIESLPFNPFSEIVYKSHDHRYPYLQKIDALLSSKQEETVFLDTDTFVLGDISRVFEFGQFDIAGCTAPFREKIITINDAVPIEQGRQWRLNSGVLFLRDRSCRLLNRWKSQYLTDVASRGGKSLPDQPALQKILEDQQPDVLILPNNYNFRLNFGGFLSGGCFVTHFHSPSMISKLIKSGLDETVVHQFISIVSGINDSPKGKVFQPYDESDLSCEYFKRT